MTLSIWSSYQTMLNLYTPPFFYKHVYGPILVAMVFICVFI